ncbi:hypothetical protein SAMN06295879_0890 [Agreia bicolorata]|uniref:Uncharacterized protein n=1 Tax=Agreia bicolorata TaxID=110935 RepID=A0A1T4XAP5_9MICO|nr:hypothetical protein [Agreia bicolorata]SKA86195.1 hypothetical protein SAMN06295879_0890 [Agreia bicolorata]
MPDTELIPPIGYSGAWLIIGIVLIVVVIAAILLILLLRASKRSSPPQPLPPGGLAGLRAEYHARITEIETEFAAGRLSARSAHHRLSAVVRQYGRAVSGIDAPVMTLTELQSSPLPTVTAAVAEYYPASFESADRSEISSAVARARQVIESWG